jgi:hypothetical protein
MQTSLVLAPLCIHLIGDIELSHAWSLVKFSNPQPKSTENRNSVLLVFIMGLPETEDTIGDLKMAIQIGNI